MSPTLYGRQRQVDSHLAGSDPETIPHQVLRLERSQQKAYPEAMKESVVDSSSLKALLEPALTDRIDDREMFVKGIDYSYYYEEDSPEEV